MGCCCGKPPRESDEYERYPPTTEVEEEEDYEDEEESRRTSRSKRNLAQEEDIAQVEMQRNQMAMQLQQMQAERSRQRELERQKAQNQLRQQQHDYEKKQMEEQLELQRKELENIQKEKERLRNQSVPKKKASSASVCGEPRVQKCCCNCCPYRNRQPPPCHGICPCRCMGPSIGGFIRRTASMNSLYSNPGMTSALNSERSAVARPGTPIGMTRQYNSYPGNMASYAYSTPYGDGSTSVIPPPYGCFRSMPVGNTPAFDPCCPTPAFDPCCPQTTCCQAVSPTPSCCSLTRSTSQIFVSIIRPDGSLQSLGPTCC